MIFVNEIISFNWTEKCLEQLCSVHLYACLLLSHLCIWQKRLHIQGIPFINSRHAFPGNQSHELAGAMVNCLSYKMFLKIYTIQIKLLFNNLQNYRIVIKILKCPYNAIFYTVGLHASKVKSNSFSHNISSFFRIVSERVQSRIWSL